ncbi:carbonic anhydrase [Nitrososphaera sp.]|uniref:carbonic anhydrase n=1 Tax=Nitrososphaera sp. TaxID=1971748 RepID=UPI00307D3D93
MATQQFRFGTAINCIDGRTQEPIIGYLKSNHGVEGVDMVTFPGADAVFSGTSGRLAELELARRAVSISVERHGSDIIAVAGHHDCAGNPGGREHHYLHIANAVRVVSSWGFPAKVVGLYVNDRWQVERVMHNGGGMASSMTG